jgi:hypothetical protein
MGWYRTGRVGEVHGQSRRKPGKLRTAENGGMNYLGLREIK